jgi:signal transduction histidine kinase
MIKLKKTIVGKSTPESPAVSSRRLLIVDDEPGILLLLRNLFSPFYMLQTAQSPQEALKILSDGFYPQVIIADQRMPGMTGAAFLAESRKIVPDAVRVTLTGYSDVKEIIESVNSGAIYRFVGKPWEDAELLETVRLCFEQYDFSTKQMELEAALARAQRLNNEKNDILGIVSHDLKNPISVILGITDLMKSNADFELSLSEYREYSGVVHQTAENMMDLVKELLDEHWLHSEGMEFTLASVSLSGLAPELADSYSDRARQKDITIRTELPSAAENVLVLADEGRLRQAIDNLVSNAVKFSPRGKNVFVRVKSSDGCARVEVQDEGPGLSEEDKSKLFGKFVRLSAKPTGGEHSTGLGLSIVKKMVEAMNGKVWCESELGKGATFIVELPLV